MKGHELADWLRSEIAVKRADGLIPTQIRISQAAWNGMRDQLKYGPFGSRDSVLFEGLPCVLTLGLKQPFRVRCIQMRKD